MGLAMTTLSGGTGEVFLVLGLLLLLPVVLLTFWTTLETRPYRARNAALATRVGLPLALSIVSLGVSLFARGSPYRAWPSEAQVWLQVLLCAPLGMFLAFSIPVAEGPGMAAVGRSVVLHFVASVVLLWSPMCNAVGFKLAVVLVTLLFVAGPWLEEEPRTPRPVQRSLAAMALLWVLGAVFVSWPHRRSFNEQIEERAAIPFVVGAACCLPGAKPAREALAQRP